MTDQNNPHQVAPHDQITRRDLFMLVVVSPSLLAHMRRGWPPAGVIEEFLSEVTASVTTCWYAFRRGALTTIEHAVPQYLPELEELVKSSSLHRKRAAYLAAQGFLLSSLVSLHRMRYTERVANCQKAVTYASASGDWALLVKSLDNLGDAFLLNEQPKESLNAYLQAEDYSKSTRISGFLRSQVLVQLSQPYAKMGKSEEVRRFLDEAYATFADADSETPVFLLTDNGRDQTILYEGSSILRLGNHAREQGKLDRAREHWMNAAETFGKMAQLPSGLEVPTRIAAQILLAQALAYALARNMEGFLPAFKEGVKLAKELRSEKRKQEAREALKEAIGQWKGDQRITGLWELL
jgi:tetratricopeptide (TPR) repeat protein